MTDAATPTIGITINHRRLELVVGDITTQAVDAIVNAANAALRGGGGVDGAIHTAAGPSVLDELRSRYPSGTPTGTAVATTAGRLKARWLIHAVGPVWRGGGQGEAQLLAGAYRSSLRVADQLGARTVALPAISLGIYRFPLRAGARIALDAVLHQLGGETSLELVGLVLYSDETFSAFSAALDELAPPA
ncbi:MAG: O-acetyl-ADP-ribose deacetylase [Chloroflexota bacterium]|nr:O-acetyl-ADP-ribose deacetylase [Chloroflexota bacterium]